MTCKLCSYQTSLGKMHSTMHEKKTQRYCLPIVSLSGYRCKDFIKLLAQTSPKQSKFVQHIYKTSQKSLIFLDLMLLLWLATTMDGFCRLAVDEDLDTGIVRTPKGWDAAAIVRDGSLAQLVTRKLHSDPETGIPAFEFGVHAHGPGAMALADAMAAAITAWDRDMGWDSRPRLIVRPRSTDRPPAPGAWVVDKQLARLEVLWQADGRAGTVPRRSPTPPTASGPAS